MNQQVNRKIITSESESPPLTIGPRRFHYQYSVLLPQIHLTLVSVLQGIAFALLLLGIPLPPSMSWNIILKFLQAYYFYLPYVISSLIVLAIWKQFVFASLLLVWPLSTTHIALIYLLTFAETIAFRSISVAASTTPTPFTSATLSSWFVGIGLIGLIGGCIRFNNLIFIKREDFEPLLSEKDSLNFYKRYRKNQTRDGIVYSGLGIAFLVLGIVGYQYLLGVFQPNLSLYAPWLLLIPLTLLVCVLIYTDASLRKTFWPKLINNSGLVLTGGNMLRYAPQIAVSREPGEVEVQAQITQVNIHTVAEEDKTRQNDTQEKLRNSVEQSPFRNKYLFSFSGVFMGVVIGFLLTRRGVPKKRRTTNST